MKHPFLLAAAAATALVAPASAQNGDLAAVQAHLRGISTMTADFQQTDRAGKTLPGKLLLRQPGRIRFQYGQGVPLLIVADGGNLTFIDYQVRQVQQWPIRNSPMGVLLDPKRDLARYARVTPSSDPRVISVEARDPKHPEYGRINLVLARQAGAPGGLTLQGWVALDSQGNRTTVRLSNQRYGAAIGDETFRWRDPRKLAPRS